MADKVRRVVEYETDKGNKVLILVTYDTDDSATTRFTDGGFPNPSSNQNASQCSGIISRRYLKPRYLVKTYGSGENAKRLEVIYKTLSAFTTAIKVQGIVRYCGECYCGGPPPT
jgi:hypothetical protein